MVASVSTAVLGAVLRQFIQGSISELQYRRQYKDRQIRIIKDKQIISDGGSTTKEQLEVIEGDISDVLETPPAFDLHDAEEYILRRVHFRDHSGNISSNERQITSSESCEKTILLNSIEEFELEPDSDSEK